MKSTTIIGLMSGTSLDGVDIASCEFSISKNGKINYKIHGAETIAYTKDWKNKLTSAPLLSGLELKFLDIDYGNYLGGITKDFITRHRLEPHFIASHGHTVFHQPGRGITLQIGSGASIAAKTGLKVICDFRSLDVVLGGQGAPLVPIGDKLLFGEYEFCLNLGGFSNISMDDKKLRRIAFDICPVNMALNHYANKLGFEFDKNGEIAAKGLLNKKLLNALNSLDYYTKKHPKSLGREWFETSFLPLIDNHIPTQDVLHTLTEHIAIQIAMAVSEFPAGKILTTGGGAENTYLIKRIRKHAKSKIVIPEKILVHYKEALVFALLGFLRSENKINTLASVTGARSNSIGGAIFQG